jgi:hypothetical protein
VVLFFFLMNLSAEAPHEILLWSFDQSSREVSELGLHLFFPSLIKDVLSIHQIVLFTISKIAFRLRFGQLELCLGFNAALFYLYNKRCLRNANFGRELLESE